MEELTASEPIIYGKLPMKEGHWTRLILLKNGKPNDPIECLLQPFDLDDMIYDDKAEKLLTYEALSYVWGDRADPREISCNGVSVKVTRNLFDALVTFRFLTASRWLWVDAICINQEDLEERNFQVACMGSIYRKAAQVLIWLGHGDAEHVEVAFTYLCQRAKNYYLGKWTQKRIEYFLESYTTRGEEVDVTKLLKDGCRATVAQYEAITVFLRQPWFSRLWVIQEASLAKRATVFWHDSDIDFESIIDALDRWNKYNYHLPPLVGLANITTIGFSRQLLRKGKPLPFAPTMYGIRNFSCFDPRDRVYGLLGMHSIGTLGRV
jgi:hypothetical protein